MNNIRTVSQLLDALKRGCTVADGAVIAPASIHAAPEPERTERHFCISVAGRIIGIDAMYSEVYSLCGNYLCDQSPEIRISVNEMDLAREREEAEWSSLQQRDGYMELLAVYRKICEAMLDYDTFLMHGAVVASGDYAYMFTAESGTGKTTHIRKWIRNIEDAYVVNGDKPLIRMTETQAIACGTPWCGKEKMNTNIMVPVKTIVLMERGEHNKISEITYSEAFATLLQQTYRPNDPEKLRKTLSLLLRMKGLVRFYKFVFNNLKEDAFDVAYQALVKENV